MDDLGRAKDILPSYVSFGVLRLTPLAPGLVGATLDGRQPTDLQLDDLLRRFPLEWERQPSSFLIITSGAKMAYSSLGSG